MTLGTIYNYFIIALKSLSLITAKGMVNVKETLISITAVSKTFDKLKVLNDINIEIKRGEIFGLIGPSGAGKTTLVKMLTNLEKQTSGEITMDGISLPSSKIISRIGYMSQSDSLYTDLTAEENLDFFGSLFGLKGDRKKQRIHEVASLVDLEEFLKTPVHKYSGGMRRRLSLAASLLHEPELLILDEPTVGIDPVLRKKIWDQFVSLKNAGHTLIVTTHVMDEAEKCDRVGLLRGGKVIAQGTPDEIISLAKAANLEHAFLVFGGEK